MGKNMKVTSKMERKMEKAHSTGLMEINILDPGRVVNNMDSVYGQQKKEKDKVNGYKAPDRDG